jgi:biuret amidohydrolase
MGTDGATFEQRMNDLLQIDPARTVVLTIDLQRDYIDPPIATRPVLVSEAERVVEANRRLLETTRALGIPTVHAYVTRREVEIDHDLGFGGLRYIVEGIRAGLSQNAQVGVQDVPDRLEGTLRSDVHPALVAAGDVLVPTKKTLDSYLYSDLDLVLGRMFKPDNVILTGVNTDTCVYSTAFSTANRGYRPIVVRECCGSMRGIDRHEKALELMSRSIAWVVGLDELLAKLPRP